MRKLYVTGSAGDGIPCEQGYLECIRDAGRQEFMPAASKGSSHG